VVEVIPFTRLFAWFPFSGRFASIPVEIVIGIDDDNSHGLCDENQSESKRKVAGIRGHIHRNQ